MKALFVCAALLVGTHGAQLRDSLAGLDAGVRAALQAKWGSFKAEHGKEYHPSEENRRMALFAKNSRVIEEHNARFQQGLESFEMAHNELADLSLDEIAETRMGFSLPPTGEFHANVSLHVPSGSLAAPAAVDWRQSSCLVQRVKNQGSCGSCYVFSAIGAFETAHCVKTKKLVDMSEQHLVDCGGRGCNGGWMQPMFEYLKNNGGSISQDDYPYKGRQSRCQAESKPRVGQVDSHKAIERGNEAALMDALATVGTISIGYNARTIEHNFYRRGILDVKLCPDVPCHAVLLVGYGTEDGKDYWTIKNSWGAGWGEDGYFRMVRGENMCGIANYASYPIAKK